MTESNQKNVTGHAAADVCVFAADLGGTHLRAATVSANGEIHFRHKQNTPRGDSAGEIVSALVQAARECEQESSSRSEHINAVSVVVPGTVNVEEGIVIKAPNLASLNGYPLAAALTEALNLPAVIENDANAATVGEMWQGAARGRRAIVGVTLGTGVGGGIILNGNLWRGAHGSAAEIGHMCVEPFGGVQCGCGSHGCLEVYASATAIVRMAREESAKYPASVLPASDDLNAEQVFNAGKAGNELALEVFRKMGTYLGIGLANLINILNPEMIVIVGGVVNGWELFAQHMHHEVSERAFPLLADRIEIVRGECGDDDAGLLGAARLAFQATESEQ